MREIEAILQKEEDLQRIEELANAEAVAAEAAEDVEKDACDVRAAPSIELCSTEEMMSVFGEFYDGDKQDMARSRVNSTSTETSVDVSATEFDLDFATMLLSLICLTWTMVMMMEAGMWKPSFIMIKWHDHCCLRYIACLRLTY